MALSRFTGNLKDLAQDLYQDLRQSVSDPLGRPVPVTLASLSGSLGVVLLWKYWRSRAKGRLPPSPKGWPVLGNLMDLSETAMHKDLLHLQEKYKLPDIFTINIGPSYPMIILNSYDVIKEAFVKDPDAFASRRKGVFGELIGIKDEIFAIDYMDPTWKERKTFVLSALRAAGFNMAKDVEEKLTDQIHAMEQYLEPFIKDKKPVELKDILARAAANVISDIIFSKSYPLEDPELKENLENIKNFYMLILPAFSLEYLPFWIGGTIYRLFYAAKANKHIDAIIQPMIRLIQNHRDTLDPDNLRDFVDIFISKKKGPVDDAVLAHTTFTFYPDAIDSLSAYLDWILLYIAVKPEVQERIHKELDNVTGGGRSVAYSDRPDMGYTEAVIAEIMRVVCIFPLTGPHAASYDFNFRGYFIPKGTVVTANIYAALNDPTVFKNPSEFKPERFLDAGGKFRMLEAWIPFSVGRRKCIGETLVKMELFMFVTRLLQKYSLRLPDGVEPPPLIPANLAAAMQTSTPLIIEDRV